MLIQPEHSSVQNKYAKQMMLKAKNMKKKGEYIDLQTFFGLALLFASTADRRESGELVDLIINQILSPTMGAIKLDS